MSETPLVYIICGEPSGDLLGARLMVALREKTGGMIRFAGIGGESMAEQGFTSLFPIADLAVMGFAEVLPRIPTVLRRLKQTLADIERLRPDVIVTIDSWGFTGRVAKKLKQAGSTIPRIHYVAPMVWAWKENRTRHLAERVDRLMCLLPNEPPYFEKAGLTAVHVGHSVMESGAGQGDGAAFRSRHGIPAEVPLLCVLPGSRRSETSRLLPVFADAMARLAQRYPGLQVVVPTVGTVAEDVAAAVRSWPLPVTVVRGSHEKYDAFAAADAALAASGTVSLELALAHLPMVIAYKVSPVTAYIAKRLIKVKFASLVNILMDRMVVPEYLLERCRGDLLADAVSALLSDDAIRREQIAGTAEALQRLGHGGPSPSARAAQIVLEAIQETRK